jgi:hypothetical protein
MSWLMVYSLFASGMMTPWFFAPMFDCTRLPLAVPRVKMCRPALSPPEIEKNYVLVCQKIDCWSYIFDLQQVKERTINNMKMFSVKAESRYFSVSINIEMKRLSFPQLFLIPA